MLSDREGRGRREDESRGDDDDVARRLGLPQGRQEAVRISDDHRTSAEASRGDLDNYYGKMLRRDNIAAAKQRLKEHPVKPEIISTQPMAMAQQMAYAPQYPQYTGYAQPQAYAGYTQQQQYAMYHGLGAQMQAAPYGTPQAYGVQGGYQQMPQQPGPQVAPAPWPRTSLLDPMQAAFGAAYDG